MVDKYHPIHLTLILIFRLERKIAQTIIDPLKNWHYTVRYLSQKRRNPGSLGYPVIGEVGVFCGLCPQNTPTYDPCHGDSHSAEIGGAADKRSSAMVVSVRGGHQWQEKNRPAKKSAKKRKRNRLKRNLERQPDQEQEWMGCPTGAVHLLLGKKARITTIKMVGRARPRPPTILMEEKNLKMGKYDATNWAGARLIRQEALKIPMSAEKIVNQIRANPRPVVVDVWAPWCGPCRAMAPALEKLAGEYEGRVEVMKVNADEHPTLVREWRVQGIPTLLIFRDGEEKGRLIGMQPRPALAEFFEFALTGEGELKKQIMPVERLLRLLAGLVLLLYGWLSAGSWVVVALGLVVMFTAVHDRCPVWQWVTQTWKVKMGSRG